MKEPNYQTAALKIEYFQSFGSPKVVRIHKFFPRHFLDLAEEPNSHSEVRDQSLQPLNLNGRGLFPTEICFV